MIEEFITITGPGNICLEGYLNRQERGKMMIWPLISWCMIFCLNGKFLPGLRFFPMSITFMSVL